MSVNNHVSYFLKNHIIAPLGSTLRVGRLVLFIKHQIITVVVLKLTYFRMGISKLEINLCL